MRTPTLCCLLATLSVPLAVCTATPGWATPPGPHRPAPPTGCTAESTGSIDSCSFIASSLSWGQDIEVVGQPYWSLYIRHHGVTHRTQVDTDTCLDPAAIPDHPGYICGISTAPGDRITVVVRSPGVVRAGDDICALDPLCMP